MMTVTKRYRPSQIRNRYGYRTHALKATRSYA